jgi:hypothetical protein
MYNIQILQDVTLYNSITAISGVTTNTLVANDTVGVGTETPNVELTVVGDISASGNVYGVNILRKMMFVVGDGLSNSFECVHNWNTDEIVATVIDTSTKAIVYPSVLMSTLTSITVEFSNVPSASAYKLTVVG